MVKPITPKEAMKGRPPIPDFVFEVVNKIISEKARKDSKIKIKQNEIINKIVESYDVTKQEIFDKKWLDFEEIYRDAGWKVTYEKPGYDYDIYFEFEFPGVAKK